MTEQNTSLYVKLTTFIGAYMKDQMSDHFTPSGNDEHDATHFAQIANLVLDSIGYGSKTFTTEFMLWIYYEQIDPKRMPDDKLSLPSLVTSIPFEMGQRVLLHPDINAKWSFIIGNIGVFPYMGTRSVPIMVAVANEQEKKELIHLISILIGCNRQEESLQSQENQSPENVQTNQVPEEPLAVLPDKSQDSA